MHNKLIVRLARLLMLAVRSVPALGAEGDQTMLTRWSWQETYVEVDPKGDLKWKPRPFIFEKGDSARYIDFEAGDDANSGESPETSWKHHPWDPNAMGKSASTRGVHTYVFKRGIAYRGRLVVKDAGRPRQPIRLTSDPAWGSGEAVL